MILSTNSVEDTIALGVRLGLELKPKSVVALIGDLGGGKTHFTKGIAKALGVKDDITSPTFVLRKDYVCTHPTIKTLYHFDAYRLNNLEAAESVGLSDALSDPAGVVVVEWADKINSLLPGNRQEVVFICEAEKTRQIKWDVV